MKKAKRKMTEAQDDKMDKRMGIKEGSARDNAMDAANGLPPDQGFSKGGMVGCYSNGGPVQNSAGGAKHYGK